MQCTPNLIQPYEKKTHKKTALKFTEGIEFCDQAIAKDSTLIDAYFYKLQITFIE